MQDQGAKKYEAEVSLAQIVKGLQKAVRNQSLLLCSSSTLALLATHNLPCLFTFFPVDFKANERPARTLCVKES